MSLDSALPDVVWGDIFAALATQRQAACLRATCTSAVAGYDVAVADGAIYVAAATAEWAAHVQSSPSWNAAFAGSINHATRSRPEFEATVEMAASSALGASATDSEPFALPRWHPIGHQHWCRNGRASSLRNAQPPSALVRVDVGAPGAYYRRRMRRHARWLSRSMELYKVLHSSFVHISPPRAARHYASWLKRSSIVRRPVTESDAAPRYQNPQEGGQDFGHDLEDPFFSDDSDTPDELRERCGGDEDAVRAHLGRYAAQDEEITLRSRLEGLNARHVIVCQTRASGGSTVSSADLVNRDDLLPSGFLSTASMETLTLLGLRSSSLTRVPDDFAANCPRLQHCSIIDSPRERWGDDDVEGSDDTSPLVIGNRVLSQTTELHTLTLGCRLASRISEIQAHFLSGSSKLRTLSLPALRNVRNIHEGFLSRAAAIERLDFTKCTKLGSVTATAGVDAEGRCNGMSGMPVVPTEFLAHCRSLRSAPGLFGVVFGPSTHRILHNVLENCRQLRVVDEDDKDAMEAMLVGETPMLLCSLEFLGRSFCLDCSRLSEGYFLTRLLQSTESAPLATRTTNHMDRVATMSRLDGLRTVVVPAWRELGIQFASACPNLTRVDFSRASSSLERLMQSSFSKCASLKELRISGLSNLQRINSNVASYCNHLATIVIEDCPALIAVEAHFARDCKRLTSVMFRGSFPVFTTIMPGFLEGSSDHLTELGLGPLVALVKFDAGHLSDARSTRRPAPAPIASFTAPGGATAAEDSIPLPSSLDDESIETLKALLRASCECASTANVRYPPRL